MLSLRLLGPLEASHDGTPLDVGGVRPQVLLALLATARGRVVQRDRLIDALWEDNPPESAHGQISIHISALRKALGAPLIETVSQGYRLRTDRIDLDVEEVER
ncbi:MAG: winged helix-turn-helix domain-containing protein, partial [Actinomycetia bacterium]|nr:winged helix-turn-helix domain-containing protein [Actinomycetes bacterium]